MLPGKGLSRPRNIDHRVVEQRRRHLDMSLTGGVGGGAMWVPKEARAKKSEVGCLKLLHMCHDRLGTDAKPFITDP